ncbi:MAG: STAS domain-containing protein [Erysipelotrichaceae bacterium]|nr:STAS domain-containing protein [Erysipelotrichaceae bacterium]
MEIIKNREDNNFEVAIIGRLDTVSSPQLQSELDEITPEAESIVLNLRDLEYISSAGLRVILLLKKAMDQKGTLVLKNVSETVMSILDVTGFSTILNIEPSENEQESHESAEDGSEG